MAANDEEVVVRISAVMDDFVAQMKQVENVMETTAQELQGAADEVKDVGKGFDAAADQISAAGGDMRSAAGDAEQLAMEFDEVANELRTMGDAMDGAAGDVEQLAFDFDDLGNEAQEAGSDLKKSGVDAKGAGEDMDGAGKKAKGAGDNVKAAADRFKAAGDQLKGVGDTMKGVGQTMSLAVTAPIVGGFGAAIKIGMDFGAQMDRVGAIAGATADQVKALEQSALDLGASTSKSAGEVAGAQEELAAMGFEVNDIIGAMPGVISAAEASGAEMADTASIMASALNIFGYEASEATKVADVLAQTANVSAADINDMGFALKYAGPPAAALGVGLEELAASVGIMTDAGLAGEQAGTTLRGALLRLTAPVEANQKLMDELGVSFVDGEGNFIGISAAVQTLEKSMEGMTDTQKAANLSQLVGQEAVSGMLALMSAGPAEIDKMTQSLENSEGASATAAEAMRDNMAGAFDEMLGGFETAAIQIQKILEPALMQVIGAVQDVTAAFINAPEGVQIFALALAGVAAAIGPILVVGGMLLGFIGSMMSGFAAIAPAVAKVVQGSTMLTRGFTLLRAAFAVLTGPVGIIIAVLTALIPVFVRLYQTNENFRERVQAVWSAIQAAVMIAVNAVIGFVQDMGAQIMAWWSEHGAMIQQAAANVWAVVGGVISAALSVIVGIFKVVWAIVGAVVAQAWSNIKGVISGAISVITGLISFFAALFTGNWSAMWDATKQIFMGALKAIWNFLQLMFLGRMIGAARALVTGMRGLISSGWSAISGVFTKSLSAIWNFLKNVFNRIVSTMSTSMASARSAVSSAWSTIQSIFSRVLATIVNTIRSSFSNVVSAIRGKLNEAKNAVVTIFNSIVSTAKGFGSKMVSVGKDMIRGLINGIKNMTGAAIDAITGVVGNVVQKAKDFLIVGSPSKLFRDEIGKEIGAGLAWGIEQSERMVGRAAESLAAAAVPDVDRMDLTPSYSARGLAVAGAASLTGANIAGSAGRRTGDAGALYRFEIPVITDGREIARASAEYTEAEIDRMKATRQRAKGVIIRR